MQGGGAQMSGASQGYQAPSYAQGGGKKISIGGIVAAAGYFLMFISIFMPLYSALGESANQLDIPVFGVISIIVVLVGIAAAVVSILTKNKVLLLIITIIEVLYAVIAVIVFAIAKSEFGMGLVSFGVGFYFWIIGIVAALVGMILDYAKKK